MRLSRYLAHCGIASRRTIDAWIEEGRIRQEGRTVSLGALYQPGARVTLDGQTLRLNAVIDEEHDTPRVLLYHKPLGEICSRSDPQGRPTVFDHLPHLAPGMGRWVSIGRLDFQTTGLLLFVSDGTLAHQLMHPKFCWERVYHVKVQGRPDKKLFENLLNHGVYLDDQKVQIERLELIEQLPKSYWVELTLRSGINRAVRRIFETVGQTVVKLKRVQYAHFTLPKGMPEGHYYELSEEEVMGLRNEIAKGGT